MRLPRTPERARNDEQGMTDALQENRGEEKVVIARRNRSNLMSRHYYVYIMTNKRNMVLYTGITGDLVRRTYEHKQKILEGFTKKYNINRLVYYEVFNDPENAIAREKQIKAGSRKKKLQLIEGMNPGWKDLYDEL